MATKSLLSSYMDEDDAKDSCDDVLEDTSELDIEVGVLLHDGTNGTFDESHKNEKLDVDVDEGVDEDSSAANDDLIEHGCEWEGCRKRFFALDELAVHVNDEHVRTLKDEEYKCGWRDCSRKGRGFNARYKMLIHVRTHTNERPHRCAQCGKCFSRLENLKIHNRSHTGERPYTCPVPGCGKAYSNSSDRFKHTRTHFEEKPYICKMDGCNKRYTDPSSLRKHMKTYGHYKDGRLGNAANSRTPSETPAHFHSGSSPWSQLSSLDSRMSGLIPTLTFSATSDASGSFLTLPHLVTFDFSSLTSNPVLTAATTTVSMNGVIKGGCGIGSSVLNTIVSASASPNSSEDKNDDDIDETQFQVSPLDLTTNHPDVNPQDSSDETIESDSCSSTKWGLTSSD